MKSVRVVTDKETGKSKGFAFVEYYDANSALAAIKHLNGHELNSRKIVVGFPSHSNLREVAKQMGENFQGMGLMNNVDEEQMLSRHNAEQTVVQSVELHEAWDLLDSLKKMLVEDRRGNKLRTFVEENPQLINAIYELEKRLGIVLPTHILMAQPKLPSTTGMQPSAAPTMMGNMNYPMQSGMGMSGNMGMSSYDQSNMWGSMPPAQQQQQSYYAPSDAAMSMPMDYSGMNPEYFSGSAGFQQSSADASQQPPTRRSRFK